MNEVSESAPAIGAAWGTLRGILREFSFATIKDVVGAAGLSIEALSHLQQKFRGGSSKGQLMDGIDALVAALEPNRRGRFVIGCVEEMLGRNPDCRARVEIALARVGFGISGTTVYPLALQVDLSVAELPEEAGLNISKAIRRFRDGDFTGAITGICGAVDQLTEEIYLRRGLGGHKDASFQERVSKSFACLEPAYCLPLKEEGAADSEIKLVWENHRKAISQAAFVLGAYRRDHSDAHGKCSSSPAFVQKALDCGVFIIRSFVSVKGRSS